MQIPGLRLSCRAPALRKRCAACGILPAISGQFFTLRPCILNGLCICRRDGCLMAGQAAACICLDRHRRLTVVHDHVGTAARKGLAGAACQTAHILNNRGVADAPDLQCSAAA